MVCKKNHHQWPSYDSEENTKNYEEHYYVIELLQTNVIIVRHRKCVFFIYLDVEMLRNSSKKSSFWANIFVHF